MPVALIHGWVHDHVSLNKSISDKDQIYSDIAYCEVCNFVKQQVNHLYVTEASFQMLPLAFEYYTIDVPFTTTDGIDVQYKNKGPPTLI